MKIIIIKKKNLIETALMFSMCFLVTLGINHLGEFHADWCLNEEARRAQTTSLNGDPFYFGREQTIVTKITLDTPGGISVSKTYSKKEHKYQMGYHRWGAHPGVKDFGYVQKFPFYIISVFYNIHCVFILMILYWTIKIVVKTFKFKVV